MECRKRFGVRLTPDRLISLRKAATLSNLSISDTILAGIQDYIDGAKTLPHRTKPTRQTAITCPPETMSRFVALASEAGMSLDDALREVVTHIVNTGNNKNEE